MKASEIGSVIEVGDLNPELKKTVELICNSEKRDINKILFVAKYPDSLQFDMVEDYKPTGYNFFVKEMEID